MSNYSQSVLLKRSQFQFIYKNYLDKTQEIKKKFLNNLDDIFFNDVENLWEVILKMKEENNIDEDKFDKLFDVQDSVLLFFDTFQFFLILTSKYM